MIKLNSARKLQAVLTGAVATAQPVAAVGYNDKTATTFDGDCELHDLNGATAVDICPAPAAGAVRQIDYLTIRNYDTAQVTVTVRINEGGTLHNLFLAVLETGETLGYTHAAGWYVNTADGSRKSGAMQDLSAYLTILAAAAGYQPLAGFADNEVPVGAVDGVNTGFTLAHTPGPAASLQLFRNGVLQSPAGVDYTLVGTVITYATAPSLGDTHVSWYRHV